MTRSRKTHRYTNELKSKAVQLSYLDGVEVKQVAETLDIHPFMDQLKKYGLVSSLNRAGHCTDNAHMESFFHSLKAELIRGRQYRTEEELRVALRSYINHFYNRQRLHSGIGYHSPVTYEQTFN